jgi:hypothetical protein
VHIAPETFRAEKQMNKEYIQIHVHLVGISIEHIRYQDVRYHEHQIPIRGLMVSPFGTGIWHLNFSTLCM